MLRSCYLKENRADMQIQVPYFVVLLIAVPLWIYRRRTDYRQHPQDFDLRREVIVDILFAYALAVAGLTLFPFVLLRGGPATTPNFIPFSLMGYLFFNPMIGMINVAGNVALFVPLGILLPLLSKRFDGFGRAVLCGLLCSLTIEVLQYRSGNRSADIDDVILNTLGAALGYVIYWAGKRIVAAGRPS